MTGPASKHIGIDFDNTIVTYDDVFYRHALRLKLILPGIERNKQVIRDSIRTLPKGNDKWTELQGLVYGKYMAEAEPMEGVESFLKACKENSVKVSIISHKTLYPAIGPRINLQSAAKEWVKNRDLLAKFNLTKTDLVFEKTLDGKVNRIAESGCRYFIDDMIEILTHPGFPKGVAKLLYGRQAGRTLPDGITNFKDWHEIKKYFFD